MTTGPVASCSPASGGALPLSDMAMLVLLRRMNRADLTVHGFRSCFRDWAAETGQPADIAEAALAHVVGDKTRCSLSAWRSAGAAAELMDAWAAFCARTAPTGEVVPLRAGA